MRASRSSSTHERAAGSHSPIPSNARAGLGQALDRRPVLLRQRGEGGAERGGDGLDVAQHLALAAQLVLLAFAHPRGIDLLRVEAQQLQPLLAQGLIPGEPLQPLGQPGVLVVRRRHRGEQGRRGLAAAAVQPDALQLGRDQAELFALAVDAEQVRTDLAEQAQGRRLIVDEDPVAALAPDLTPHDQLVALGLEPGGGERRAPVAPGGPENAGDDQTVGAGADEIGGGASAGQQGQRVDDDRFARPGLAGEHVEARPELDLGAGQHREIAHVEGEEHGRGASRVW